jgi:hypothetical protein
MFSRLLRLSVTIGLTGCALAASVALSAPHAPGEQPKLAASATTNLLINPDFEDGYYFYPGHNSIRVPNGWGLVWYTDTPPISGSYPFNQPEVSVLDCVWPNCNALNYPPRINTGLHAVESGKRWGNQDVSLVQTVGHVPIGARVSAEAWLAAWVSSCDPNKPPYPMALSLLSDNASGCLPGAWPTDSNHMLIGIDPFGGADPRASSVVWNWDENNPAWWGPYDYYSSTAPAVAVAQAHTVTLFLRGVTVQPAKFNTVYFDTARLIYDFPLTWQIDRGYAWPLSQAITIGLQTPVSLTQVSVELQDPIGSLSPIDPLGSSVTAPYTIGWRFVPALAGTYRFTVTAYELPDPLAQLIEVPALPFRYWQDRMLTPGDTTLITFVLSSPVTLTNLSSAIADPVGLPLTATLMSADFVGDGYNFVWQFSTEARGLHTVTLNAEDFITPFTRFMVAATSRIYLPITLK